MSPLNGNTEGGGGGGGGGRRRISNNKNYIEHQVSKLDTLAGVAIKYGVEVADIIKLNGLATDLQMFALNKLLIPLPGRHPPSSSASSSPGGNSLDKTPPHSSYSNVMDSFESLRLKSTQQKVSPAMSTLQKYYGLKSSNHKGENEGTEMAVYRTGSSNYLKEGLLSKTSPVSRSPYHDLKSRNFNHGLLSENGIMVDYIPLAEAGDAEGEKSNEKSVRRCQKSEADSRAATTPEKLLKGENNGGSSDFSPVTGKGLAMRPKSASRTVQSTESEPGWLNSILVGIGDSIDGLIGLHKSSSTPSLRDQDSSYSSSVWSSSKWSLKPDLQALSTAASLTTPIFDGLPKPISGRRSKAALD